MKRRIVLSLLIFCLTVIAAMLVTTATFINRDHMENTRQTMLTICRVVEDMAREKDIWEAEYPPYTAAVYNIYTTEFSGSFIPEAIEKGEAWRTGTDENGIERIAVCAYSGGSYVIIVEAPVEETEGSLMYIQVMAVFAFVVVMSILFALYLAASITRPIFRLSRASLDFMGGNYSSRVEIKGRDELSRLGDTFNGMADKLQQTILELNEKSAEIETIINAMLNGFLAVDAQMHVIRINPAAKRLFNVHGNTNGEYILDVTRNAKLEQHLITAMEQGELYTADLPARVDNVNRVLRLYITGLQQDGVSIGAIALLEDVTELRRLEQMRFDFVANVTHELKTPLTSIRGFVETLQHGAIEDPDAARRFLSIIAMESERLTRLIDDILSLSSLEAGRKKDDTRVLAFAPFVQQIIELLRSNAMEKNISLFFEDSSRNAAILASEDKVKQLLINLIDNAIKYTLNDGNVWVHLATDNERLVLTVRDSGIGIEAEHIPRLFERFYRVDKGRSRNMGGTGLGLAIVKHIIREMNGKIDVISEPGAGTTFTVKLPLSGEEE